MSQPVHHQARRQADPQARARLRQAQAAEARAVAGVYGAQAKLAAATAKRDRARAVADGWVSDATAVLDTARAGLASVSGVDRAALLLDIGKTELRRSLTGAAERDGAS